jgi:HAE1 family hydrophobic/amphiphilic exporter-1
MNLSGLLHPPPCFHHALLMAAIVVGGLAGYRSLAVSALPNVDFPTIQVTATLPGASPETMASSVASPLERQFSTIAGISSMTSSTSFLGNTQITIQFDLGPQHRWRGAGCADRHFSTATPRLPKRDADPALVRKGQPGRSAIFFIAVSSDTHCRSIR